LEKNGFDVVLVDGIAEGISLDEFFDRLKSEDPDVVVYEVSTPSIDHDLMVAKKTKEILGEDRLIVFCGPHHYMYKREFLLENREVDVVLIGEYEFTLLELAQRLREKKPIYDTLGTICKNQEEVIVNPRRPLEQDLDKFPWPARHHLPMYKYVDLPGGIPAPSLQMWASRGCPFKCIFCSWPQIMYGSSLYRVRNPVDVVEEIEWCIKEYGFKSIYFDDDTFNIGKDRILKLCKEMKSRKINLPWAIMARADQMDRELLENMKEAGLVALKYGVESGDQKILDSSGKSLSLEKLKETVRITRELGIKYHLTFMFGLPGETWDSIHKTIDLALELDPDTLQFSIVTPFPGSRYFEMLEKKGYILSTNWEEYDGYNKSVIRTEFLSSRDLERALRLADRTWKRHLFFRKLKEAPFETIGFVITHPIYCLRSYLRD